jgi:hypothetical protein
MPQQDNVRSIMSRLADWSRTGELHTPAEWLEEAMKLASLLEDLRNEVTNGDIAFRERIIAIQESAEKKMSKTDAEDRAMVEKEIYKADMSAYRYYSYLNNRLKTAEELIRVAKERSKVQY